MNPKTRTYLQYLSALSVSIGASVSPALATEPTPEAAVQAAPSTGERLDVLAAEGIVESKDRPEAKAWPYRAWPESTFARIPRKVQDAELQSGGPAFETLLDEIKQA